MVSVEDQGLAAPPPEGLKLRTAGSGEDSMIFARTGLSGHVAFESSDARAGKRGGRRARPRVGGVART